MSVERAVTSSAEVRQELEAATARLQHSVSPETRRKYGRLFTNVWTPVCQGADMSPVAAPPTAVLKLMEAARTGALRQDGNGNQRSGMVSPGYLAAVLAAVRHQYAISGAHSPLDGFTRQELIEIRRGYARDYQSARPAPASAPIMTVRHLRRLCNAPSFATREEGAIAALAVLSLDAHATLEELVRLEDKHIQAVDSSRVDIDLGGRSVSLHCQHAIVGGVVPTCGACLIRRFLTLPAAGPAVTAAFGLRPDHQPGSRRLRIVLYTLLRRAASLSPALEFGGGRGGLRLGYAEGGSLRLAIGARQLLTVAGTPAAKRHLMAQTALKLVAARGVTAADLFDRLTVADVRQGRDARGGKAFLLRLPVTMRARAQDRDWITVVSQPDADLCPVLALRQWLLVREAAAGEALDVNGHVFVTSERWADGATAITTGAARICFQKLLQAARLQDRGYLWESAQKLHASSLQRQKATELQLYKTLRRKKPQQMHAMLAELPGAVPPSAAIAHQFPEEPR